MVQVAFIYLVLPTSLDVNFPHALRHVAVGSLEGHNLGPLTSEGCRTLLWSVSGGLELEQALIVRRCHTMTPLAPDLTTPTTAASSDANITVSYTRVNGVLSLEMPATSTTSFGYNAEFKTHVYRPEAPRDGGAVAINAASSATLPLVGAFDFGQLEPLFSATLAEGEGTCALVAGSGTVCARDRFGDVTSWRLECADATAQRRSMTRLVIALALHVDLRVAPEQSAAGFAAGLERGVLQQAQELGNSQVVQLLRTLEASTSGGGNVVARVKAPRVNLATALILAAVAIVAYQLMQLGDSASAAAALRCKSAHAPRSGGHGASSTSSGSCAGSTAGDTPKKQSAHQLEAQPVAADDAAAGNAVAGAATHDYDDVTLAGPPWLPAVGGPRPAPPTSDTHIVAAV